MARIAGVLQSPTFPAGDRAQLRRLNSRLPPGLTFFRFALHHLPPNWERSESQWMCLVSGIALMSPHAHRPGRRLGAVLAEAKYSEFRLERLLAAAGATRQILFQRAVRLLASRSLPFDWTDGARLLLTADPDRLERVQLQLASDYYGADQKLAR